MAVEYFFVSSDWSVEGFWWVSEKSEAGFLESVHKAVGNSCSPSPRVNGGTRLASPHVSHPALVPQVAHLGIVTPRGPMLVITVERLKVHDLI